MIRGGLQCLLVVLVLGLGTALGDRTSPVQVLLDDCGTGRNAPVVLRHRVHVRDHKVACDKCHHTQKGLRSGTAVKPCQGCHGNPTDSAPSCQAIRYQQEPVPCPVYRMPPAKGARWADDVLGLPRDETATPGEGAASGGGRSRGSSCPEASNVHPMMT